jgi:hypothetical protein
MQVQGKVDPFLLRDSLGHSDLRTTQVYEAVKDMEAINELNRLVTA